MSVMRLSADGGIVMLAVAQLDNGMRGRFVAVILTVIADILLNHRVADHIFQVAVHLLLVGSKI